MARLVFDAQDIAGESLVRDDRRGRLVRIDIIGRRIRAPDPATGAHQSWETPGRVTSIGLCEDGGATVGLERHIALRDRSGPFRRVRDVEPYLPGNRLNEAVVGPDGAFRVGRAAAGA
jgi:sugar lactone lactonase YvrE